MKLKVYLNENLRVDNTDHDLVSQYSKFELQILTKRNLAGAFTFSWITPGGVKIAERTLSRKVTLDEGNYKGYAATIYPGMTAGSFNNSDSVQALFSVRGDGISSPLIKAEILTSIMPEQTDIEPTEADLITSVLNAHIGDKNNPHQLTAENINAYQKEEVDLLIEGVEKQAGPQGPKGEDGKDGKDGADGAMGPTGPAGPKGNDGAPGAKGEKGDPGARGLDGLRGNIGPEGPEGPRGPMGPEGPRGFKGDRGLQGPEGLQGPQGPVGARGPEGRQGAKGDTGERGPRGETGPRGLQGLQGEKGEKGDKGDRGEKGIQGIRGPQGEQGLRGERGERGPQGERGADGADGAQGLKGDRGEEGRSFDIVSLLRQEIDLPSPYTAPTNHAYLISHDANNIKFDDGDHLFVVLENSPQDMFWYDLGAFTAIKGEQGEQGEQGPKGDTGPQGLQGIQGIQGPEGPIGKTGPEGPQGLEGEKGEKGDKGDKGNKGDIGPIGETGLKGDKGDKGDIGPEGLRGPEGPEGPQGVEGPKGEPGRDGIDGEKGEKGDTGLQGPEGPRGPKGEEGPEGPQGPEGPTGPIGETGPEGPQGPKGEEGPEGPRGEIGPEGPQGDRGLKGDRGDKGEDGDFDLELFPYMQDAARIYRDNSIEDKFKSAWEHSLEVNISEIEKESDSLNQHGRKQYPEGETYGVIIPKGTTSIGKYAFYKWTSNNQPLVIPNSVTSIGNLAFSLWYANNQPLVIPNSVTSIGIRAFESWSANTHPLVISNSVTSIGEYAFASWTSNNHPLVIPNSVTSIGSAAFYKWTSNTHPLVIPDSVTSIDSSAFSGWGLVPYVEMKAITPPSLVHSNAFSGQNNAPIYVPDESVDAYKNATNWSVHADRIKPVSELHGGGSGGIVYFEMTQAEIDAGTSTDPRVVDPKLIKDNLNTKQDKLTAGENITIVDNVISAVGGGGGTTYPEMTQTLIDEGASTDSMVISPKLLKDNLDNKADKIAGDGDKFLSDDGTYKSLYSKTEIDSMVGDIGTLLGVILDE